MKAITDEIERALSAELYYLAVFTAVALPDICGAMEYEDGRATPGRYKDWYEKWLHLPIISSDQMYCLRSGIVHQGRANHKGLKETTVTVADTKANYDRIFFSLPCPILITGSVGTRAEETVHVTDAGKFCRDIVAAVSAWYEERKDDPVVSKNMEELFRLRPVGDKTNFIGIPVIG